MEQTTLDDWAKDALVDPEIRAHVYSLISALGGAGDDGTYSLGDDALLCLKDLRKWLRVADAQHNRRDVARCMAEANLVKGDLLEILAKIAPRVIEDKLKHKIAIACLELLVPLTWPMEIDPGEATVNHHRHGPYIKLAQINYKRAILQFDRAPILQTAVRMALPSMAITRRERSPRDEGIIRIALYFIRNVVMLSPPKGLPLDSDETEVSRSTTIDVLHEQDIFQVILSVASSIGEEFETQDVAILEILFYLLKGVDAEKLFMEEKKLSSKNTEELKMLMQKEKAMHAGYARHAPTRHNRFGTMLWVKRGDDKVSTVSGQDVLGKAQRSLEKLDQVKKYNKPRRAANKTDDKAAEDEFDLPVALSSSARRHLKSFVEDFLDSSFNPLFLHLRKAIEREVERIEDRHGRQYFYLASWFLRAECARRRTIKQKASEPKSAEVLNAEDESYALIAEVMNQETFVLLNRFLQKSHDEKAWQDLNAGMKCFTQILLTVQEMAESAIEDDQEIAENIQNRIFYEETTHDRVMQLLRSYNNQGFGYLDACTELAHVFLRMLERYSKQNVDLQIRSKRRSRKIRKDKAKAAGENEDDEGNISEAQDVVEAQRTVTERRFDFARFAAKFTNQSSVDTFVAFTRFYRDLSNEQLKRAHRFFYRVAFKAEMAVLLCRVDILQLFHKMIKGEDCLDKESPVFKEWEEFVRHFFRQVVKRVEERPELIVEMLFSKIPQTLYFLEHGHDREVVTRAPRAPAELEVKPGMSEADQIGVAVGVLVNQQKSDGINWVRDVLSAAAEERQAWQDMEEAQKALTASVEGETASEPQTEERSKPQDIVVKPDNEERRVAMFKDNKLRLLMKLVGMTRIGADNDPDAVWIIPSTVTNDELKAAVDLIRKFQFDPPVYEDGKGPEELLRSKAAAARARRVEYDDDTDGIDDDDSQDDRGEYDIDAPTSRKSGGRKLLRRRRRRAGTPQELNDEERERKAETRRQREREKQAKIKSTMFVHDSDDEDDPERDEEFFAREAAIREGTKYAHIKSLEQGVLDSVSKKRKAEGEGKDRRKKQKSVGPNTDDDSDIDMHDRMSLSSQSSSEDPVEKLSGEEEEEEDEADATDTPLSSQPVPNVRSTDAVASTTSDKDVEMEDDDDDEEDGPVVRRVAARTRGGFVIESDSE